MRIQDITKVHKNKKSKTVGRGSKRGKTSGRGTKGQNARAGHKKRPEIRDTIKKLPKLRGHCKNRGRTVRTNRIAVSVVNLSLIDATYKAVETVSPSTLLAKDLVRRAKGRVPVVKILGTGPLTKALVIDGCAVSTVARTALLASGGTIHA